MFWISSFWFVGAFIICKTHIGSAKKHVEHKNQHYSKQMPMHKISTEGEQKKITIHKFICECSRQREKKGERKSEQRDSQWHE